VDIYATEFAEYLAAMAAVLSSYSERSLADLLFSLT
jgi:hypothetical protein